MRTRLAATALTLSLGVGGAAGLFLTHTASAATGSSSTTAPAAGTAPTDADRTAKRTDQLTSALQGLVDAGTITTAQRDAVVQALLAAQPAGDGGGGRGGHRGGGAGLEAAAAALGTDVAGLRALLTGGKTIAQAAADKGIAVDTVIAAVVAAETARIDQAVTDGKLTQAQADAKKAALTEQVTALVNGTLPMGKGGPKSGGRGSRGDRQAPATPATSVAPASTTA